MGFFTFYVIELSNMFQGETVHDTHQYQINNSIFSKKSLKYKAKQRHKQMK